MTKFYLPWKLRCTMHWALKRSEASFLQIFIVKFKRAFNLPQKENSIKKWRRKLRCTMHWALKRSEASFLQIFIVKFKRAFNLPQKENSIKKWRRKVSNPFFFKFRMYKKSEDHQCDWLFHWKKLKLGSLIDLSFGSLYGPVAIRLMTHYYFTILLK